MQNLQQNAAVKHENEAELEVVGGANEPEGLLSKEAAKQRLRRVCTGKADGILGVPQAVRDAWKAGGASRDRLLTVFMNNGYDKDSFVRQITHEFKQTREVKVQVTGDFYTEESMVEELKLTRCESVLGPIA